MMESMTVGKIKPQSDCLEEMLERKIDKKKGRGQKGKTERKKKKEDPISERLHIASCSPL